MNLKSLDYFKNFCLRYKNYFAVVIASLCIWRWYWGTDVIGMHDAWDAVHYLKTIYESWRGGLIPFWQPFILHKQYFFAGGEYPALPFLSLIFTYVLSLSAWIKTHYYIYLLFGACGMVALLEKLRCRWFMPALFALVSFFSERMLAFVYYQYTWIPMWAFMPWMLFFLVKSNDDWRYSAALAVTTALFIASAPAHAFIWASGSLVVFSLFYLVRDITVFFRTIASLLVGTLLAAPVLLPLVTYNWSETGGRAIIPLQGYFDAHQFITSFIGRFNQHHFVYFFDSRILMWHEFYSYIGFIPAFLIVAGLTVMLCRFRRFYLQRSIAFFSFMVAALIFVYVCGNNSRIISYLHLPFVKSNAYPHRMTVAMIFWLAIGACTSLSAWGDTANVKVKRIMAGLTLAALIFITVDYTMLFRQIDEELHASAKKMTVSDLKDPEWLTKNTLAIEWNNKNAKIETELIVPGNGLYFIGRCENETEVWFPNLDDYFVERYLHIRNVLGRDIRKEGHKFILPAGEYCYRLYFKDISIYAGVFISLLTIALVLLMRNKIALLLQSKTKSIFF